MWRYKDPCPDKPTTLYLVSAMKKGINYWKVGITQKDDPLKRDSKHYQEVFRAEKIEWAADAELIEINVARTFKKLMFKSMMEDATILEPPAREGLSYDFPVEVPIEIYDWWLNLAQTSDRVANPHYEPDEGNGKYLLAEYHINNIETAFYYCQHAINHGAIFDFNNQIYKTHKTATIEELQGAFGQLKSCNVQDENEKLRRYREHAERYYKLTDEYIPQLQRLLSFRPDRPILKKTSNEPMWD